MSDSLIEIQEDLFEYFKDMNDINFIAVVDKIVYHNGDSNSETSKLCEKFLEDNGLVEAYLNYIMEMNKQHSFFLKHPSDIEMIENIKRSLLSLSYNRFRRSLNKSTPKSTPLARLSKQEKNDLTMVIEECQRHNDDLISDGDYTRTLFNKEEADDVISERKRLKGLFTKVLKILK